MVLRKGPHGMNARGPKRDGLVGSTGDEHLALRNIMQVMVMMFHLLCCVSFLGIPASQRWDDQGSPSSLVIFVSSIVHVDLCCVLLCI